MNRFIGLAWQRVTRGAIVKFAALVLAVANVIIATCIPSAAIAQTETGVFIPPAISVVDQNGVDILSGLNVSPGTDISIGSADSLLVRSQSFYVTQSGGPADSLHQDNFYGRVCLVCSDSGSPVGYIFGPGFSKANAWSDDGYTFEGPYGDPVAGAGYSIYTTRDGVQYRYEHQSSFEGPLSIYNAGTLSQVKKPSGEIININRLPYGHIESVSSNYGYMLKYEYTNGLPSKISPVNLSQNYCQPSSYLPCPGQDYSRSLSMSYVIGLDTLIIESGNVLTRNYTNALSQTVSTTLRKRVLPSGRTYEGNQNFQYYEYNSNCLEILDPICVLNGSFTKVTPTGTHTYTVSNVNRPCTTYSNQWGDSPSYVDVTGVCDVRVISVTNPLGGVRKYMSSVGQDGLFGKLVRYLVATVDENGLETNYVYYNDATKLRRIVYPEGNYSQFTYDARKNVTERREVAKPGSGLADRVWTAAYPPTCASLITCNKPIWVRDPKGNEPANIGNAAYRTDFTYDTVHGGLLTETSPPVTDPVNGQLVRPQKRYTYTPLYAQVKNSSGALVNAEGPIYKLTKVSICSTATSANPAACVGTANETITLYEYNHTNLLKTAEIVAAGNANLAFPSSATNLYQKISYGYDYVGNLVSVDGPRTDVDDTSYIIYDVLRRPVFEIGVDPDGSSGALKRSVLKHSYDVDGNETLTETGTGSVITFSSGVPTSVTDFAVSSFKRNTYSAVTGQLTKTEVGAP